MSGSPVYIDGRLVGAVALAFNFSKEPIAGIRPIEEMLAVGDPAAKQVAAQAGDRKAASNSDSFASKLIDIATPVSFSGFTAGTLEQFSPQLKKLGLEPRQGVSSGGKLPSKLGTPASLRPGDMIAVELLSGDMSIGAEGTVTAVDGKSIYAFGHQFMSVGNTELPFARAEPQRRGDRGAGRFQQRADVGSGVDERLAPARPVRHQARRRHLRFGVDAGQVAGEAAGGCHPPCSDSAHPPLR